jgi:hypothetical protein
MKRCWNLTLLLLPTVCTACMASPWIQYAALGVASPAAASKPESGVEIYLDPEKPARAFKIVSLVKMHFGANYKDGVSEAVKALRSRVASEGLDGVMLLCGKPGTVGGDQCDGKGFVYTP